MHIWRSVDEVPADLGRTVVVIGNFDGVHQGHRHVVRRAREIADKDGLLVVAVTFDPHPMAVLRPDHAPLTLTDVDSRCVLLAEAGADDVLVIPFSREIADWTPEVFIARVLVGALPGLQRPARQGRGFPLRPAQPGKAAGPLQRLRQQRRRNRRTNGAQGSSCVL